MEKNELLELYEKMRESVAPEELSAEQVKLMEQVEFHLHQSGDPDPEEPGIQETMEQLLAELETDHPQASGFLQKIISLLSGMGI